MSHRIANKSDMLDYCGQIPLKTEIKTTVTIGEIYSNAPVSTGNIVTVLNTPQDVCGVKVYQFQSMAAGILVDQYQPGQTVDVYAISENAVELCGKGVISMVSTGNRLPIKDDVLTLWNCSLKNPSAGYDDVQLVRQEDLIAVGTEDPQYVTYYFNSAYVNIIVQNRGVAPVISSSDKFFEDPSTEDAYLNYSWQKGFCNSYIKCCVGDIITIQIKENSQIEHDAYVWDIAYEDDGAMIPIGPLEDALNFLPCRNKEITFQITSSMYNLSSEYFVILSYPAFYFAVHGVWLNPPQELADGTYPTCTIYISNIKASEGDYIYQHYNGQIMTTDKQFSFNTDLSALVKIHPNTAIFEEMLITVTGDDGQEIFSETFENTASEIVQFNMPKQRCTVTVTTKGITDNSTVLSSVLSVLDYTRWDKPSAVINNIELVCHADEDIVIKPRSYEKYSDNHDYRHEFNVNILKSKWENYSSTINATLRISLNSAYESSISSLLTNNSVGPYPTITVDNSYKYVPDLDMRSDYLVIKRNSSSTYDFVLKLQLVKDKSYQIKCELAGEPFIIKTTETDKPVYELSRLVTGGWYGDWGWTQNSVVGFYNRQYGDIYGTGSNSSVPFYTFIVPYSNFRKLPEYVTPKVFKSQYNHGLGETYDSQAVRSSELTIPSTVTTMGGDDGINALPALQYAGFYKVSAPGLMEKIPELSFKSNWNLQEFTVPDNVHTICEKAFAGAGDYYRTGKSSKPFSINLNNTTTIESGAFCQAYIKTLTIPPSITSITSPLYSYGVRVAPCYIEDLTWDKKTETYTLRKIFGKGIDQSLKKLTIGTNVEWLPEKFLVIKGDVFQTMEYLGTKEQWESKFRDKIFYFWDGTKPITVQCSDGDLTYFNT